MSSSNTERSQGEVLVEMPQMGVSVAEGTVTVWHKQVGEDVRRDEIICEVSTDKIDTDVPSPAAGRVVELLVAVEETVPVGTPLARIDTAAAAGAAAPAAEDHRPVEEAAELEQAAVAAPAARGNGRLAGSPHGNGTAGGSRIAVYSPVVQRLAAAHGIDPATVKGSGRGGRVRKQDVLAAADARATEDAPPAPSRKADRPEPGARTVASTDAPAGEPLSRMRRTIAEHMTRSLQTAAHCTTIVEADFSRVAREQQRIGCSPLALVARAAVEALGRHPELNATLEGEILTRHRDVNLGIAVSLQERGLIVPVIHRAQELSAEGIAARIGELAGRARAQELTADEVRGGTFTITNPGGFGSIASTPIINQPQVAILDLEAVVKRPVAITDESGADAIAIRPMANLCLSWDHRALDGASAAQFLGTLRGLIEGKEVT